MVQSFSLCASVPNTSDDHLDDHLGDNFTWHPLVIICINNINNIFVLTFEWLGDSRSASSNLLQRETREVLEIQRLWWHSPMIGLVKSVSSSDWCDPLFIQILW